MGNGEGGIGRPQDHVGVVTPWKWPSIATLVDNVPDGALDAIKARVLSGEYRQNEQAKDWAGKVVADILELDVTEPADKKRIKRLLAAWITAGHFKVESRKDAVRRELKDFIVSLPNLETGGRARLSSRAPHHAPLPPLPLGRGVVVGC
jgi:hypothetical protein